MELKNLEFTEQDFKLLIEGLDALPNRHQAGQIMETLVMGMIERGSDTEKMAEVKRDREAKRKEAELERQQEVEDIRILQGKLLMLKRFMQTQGAIKTVDDIFNPMK